MDADTDLVVSHQGYLCEAIQARFGIAASSYCHLVVYEKDAPPQAPGVSEIRLLTPDYAGPIAAVYETIPEPEYIAGRIEAGQCFGAFVNGKWAGFAGLHDEGSMGFLQVLPEYRRLGVGLDLNRAIIGYTLDRGWTPYAHIKFGNAASLRLCKKTGFTLCWDPIFWCF